MTPEQLLDEAATLMERPRQSMRRLWPRCCAALTRLAMEKGLHVYWERTAPELRDSPMRHQLLALHVLADSSTAIRATHAWHGLSRATHHHVYELAPTYAELRSWHGDVVELLGDLGRRGGVRIG